MENLGLPGQPSTPEYPYAEITLLVTRLDIHWDLTYGLAKFLKCDTFDFGAENVELLWGSRNSEKIRARGLLPEDVETAFDAADWASAPSEMEYRFIGEGTSNSGRLLRVIYAETEDGPYPITAFPIRLRQRRTP